jgi:hypothetical protein
MLKWHKEHNPTFFLDVEALTRFCQKKSKAIAVTGCGDP